MQDCSAWDCAKAMCQDRARTVSKSTQALDPWNGSQQCSPAAFCLVRQFGDSFTSTMLWKPVDFHAYPGQGEGPKRTKFGFYCVLHLLLLRYEPEPLRSASQQVLGSWRCCSSEPLTIFCKASWVSPLPEAASIPGLTPRRLWPNVLVWTERWERWNIIQESTLYANNYLIIYFGTWISERGTKLSPSLQWEAALSL